MVSKPSLWTPSSRTKASIFDIYISHYPSQKQEKWKPGSRFPTYNPWISSKWQKQQLIFDKYTRVSVSPLKSMNFPKNDKTKHAFLEIPESLFSFICSWKWLPDGNAGIGIGMGGGIKKKLWKGIQKVAIFMKIKGNWNYGIFLKHILRFANF